MIKKNRKLYFFIITLIIIPLISSCSRSIEILASELVLNKNQTTSIKLKIAYDDIKFLRSKNIETYIVLMDCSNSETSINYGVDWDRYSKKLRRENNSTIFSYPIDLEYLNNLDSQICTAILADGYSFFSANSKKYIINDQRI